MSNTKKTPALAHYAAKEVTPVIAAYAAWLEEQTGYKVDPLSVQLGSALRAAWQAEVRAEKEAAAKKPVPAKRAPRKPAATTATPEGVVIAEQNHVEVA